MKAHLAQRRHPFDRSLEGVELSGADWTSDGPQGLVDSHPGSGFNLRVLDPEVHWTYSSPAKLTKMYGSVQLLEECALGQWCCIDRETGRLRWEAHDLEPSPPADRYALLRHGGSFILRRTSHAA